MPKPYTPNDRWSRKAKFEGYRARSVYKLEELDLRFNLFKSGQRVMDVGAAPGSWLQYIAQKVGKKGVVIGIDIQEIESVADNVKNYVLDVNDLEGIKKILAENNLDKVDLVVSDIAPNTTGIKSLDQAKSVELSRMVFEVGKRYLEDSGKLIMKVFEGMELIKFIKELKSYYRFVRVIKVGTTRSSSNEVYLVCCKY